MRRLITTELLDPQDPFSVIRQRESLVIGDPTVAVYGREYVSEFLEEVVTTPAGRTQATAYDDLGRAYWRQFSGLAPVEFAYGVTGRVETVTAGKGADARAYTFGYAADGTLATVTDPLGRAVAFTRDAAGRVMNLTLPGGQIVGFDYDARGNLTSLTTPTGATHAFTWSPVNKATAYTPPAAAGAGATAYAYDLDRRPTRVTRPDGVAVDFGYDPGGRLTSVSWPGGTQTYTHDATTRHLRSVTAADGGVVAFGFDGPLPTSIEWTGEVAGRVDLDFGPRFEVASVSVNGEAVAYARDADGLITQAGNLSLTRDPAHGRVTATALGGVTDVWGYNALGELTTYAASHGATSLYATAFTRDALGRVSQEVETVEGMTHTYAYTYDSAGRLAEVRTDGVATESYGYDLNGNRVSGTNTRGADLPASYDAQDRVLSYGSFTYAFTAAGELASRSEGGQATTYAYDVLGNLLQVGLPDGRSVSYVVDGLGRRIGKEADGALTRGFLYQDRLNPVAELDAAGAVVSHFVYASKRHVPDYMVRDGATYRVVSDHLGSVRLVVDAATAGGAAARLRRVRAGAAGHQPGLPALWLCRRAVRPGHRARALRGAGLRPGDRAVDGQGPDRVCWRGCESLWVCRQ